MQLSMVMCCRQALYIYNAVFLVLYVLIIFVYHYFVFLNFVLLQDKSSHSIKDPEQIMRESNGCKINFLSFFLSFFPVFFFVILNNFSSSSRQIHKLAYWICIFVCSVSFNF